MNFCKDCRRCMPDKPGRNYFTLEHFDRYEFARCAASPWGPKGAELTNRVSGDTRTRWLNFCSTVRREVGPLDSLAPGDWIDDCPDFGAILPPIAPMLASWWRRALNWLQPQGA